MLLPHPPSSPPISFINGISKVICESIEGLGAQHLTPLQCVDAAQRYVSAATQHESSWRPRLEKDFDLPVSLLHWIGILLISDSSAVRWRLGTHMLRSASELGYDPSTLSLVRIFSSVPLGMQKKVASSKIYIDANARFQKILRQGTDPDALTLQGIILAKSGVKSQEKQALDLFRRAEKAWELKAKSSAQGDHGAQAGATSHTSDTQSFNIKKGAIPDYVSLPEPRTPRWDWEVSWALEQGKILQRQDRHKEARALFRVAALELDNPQGFWQLACLMDVPQDSPERRTYLLKAAISGVQEACRELGLLEKMAAEKTGLGEKDRTDREMMSREWFRLADGEDLKLIQDEEEA
ncbi:hypothetical protein J7T55_009623 [Diaporthe amygdali]|uniref:uncharacterized protein n=1 Tax=Phomopsis amygdali TaxID=1214568 RepID=UPI0022FE0959|nr:uncharacterized protein J7T55_009623 [Diaporthe amygdali]KAJ0109291.1 hypothetical protein J7T55_009623 [Diaporthe amygdali]